MRAVSLAMPGGVTDSAAKASHAEDVSHAVSPPSVSTIDSWRRLLVEDVLRGIRPQSGLAYWPEFRAPWGVGCQRDWAVFHNVAQGACWLHLKGWKEPVLVSEGDFVVVRRAQCHTMQDSPSTPAVDFADLVRTLAARQEGICVFRRHRASRKTGVRRNRGPKRPSPDGWPPSAAPP
jgi:hypothetical protein